LSRERGPFVCDVSALPPDAVSADIVARLRLLAGRTDREIWFAFARDELKDLLAWMGLGDVIRFEP
jgi:hypothetical protein